MSEVPQATVLIGMPTYLNRIEDAGVVLSLIHASKHHRMTHSLQSSSANCFGFNLLWLHALDQRKNGVTHFLMLHSDIVPEMYFVDKMVAIMEREKTDILSVLSPIKDDKGMTSTALDEPVGDADPKWRVRRLTMKEMHKRPLTWTHEKLLVNTGCMLVDIRKPWVDNIFFHMDDGITTYHGKKVPALAPEDWNFSRDARKLGATMHVTREVQLRHVGPSSFPNNITWGLETDQIVTNAPEIVEVLTKMEKVDGWFTHEEAANLYNVAMKATGPIVEVGSWKGRSTVVLGSAAKKTGFHVFAVDPHKGDVSDAPNTGDTLSAFMKNVMDAGVMDVVTPIVKKSSDVNGEIPHEIGMVFIDGLHDYENVKADFNKFAPKVKKGGFVAFHDWSEGYPGVQRVVTEALATQIEGKPWMKDAGSAGALKVLEVCS